MRDILGIEPTVLCSDGINKAYVLTVEDLQHFFEFGKRWINSSDPSDAVISCKYIAKGTKEAHISENIKSILEYRNPRKMEICNISMTMGSRSKERNFELSFQNREEPNLIQVYIGGPILDETQSTYNLLRVELDELTQWYWWIACRRWLRRILTWVLFIFLVLYTFFTMALAIGTTYHNYQARKQYEHAVIALPSIAQRENKTNIKLPDTPLQNNSSTQSSPVNIARSIWNIVANKYFLGGIGIVIGGWLTVLLVNYLFPKAIFEIGKGKERHAQLKTVRKYVGYLIVMIILSGIVFPLVSRFVSRLAFGE
jgi:hypothetical protein